MKNTFSRMNKGGEVDGCDARIIAYIVTQPDE